MTTNLVLLGTSGGPRASVHRAATAQAIVVDGQIYIIDFGNGIGRQMVAAALSVRDVRAGFLTHHHSDHNADIGTLFLTEWALLNREVQLIGPPPLAQSIEYFFESNTTDISMRMSHTKRTDLRHFIRTQDIDKPGTVFEDDLVRVSAAIVQHPPVVPSFAYRFDTADRSIVISGDTAPSTTLVELARNADTLIHEVIALDFLSRVLAENSGADTLKHLRESHTSIDAVGAIAEEAGVGTLVLSHFVPDDDSISDEEWKARAQNGFSGSVISGRDLMVL